MNSEKIKEFMDRLTYLQRHKPINSSDYNNLVSELAMGQAELARLDELSYRHSLKSTKYVEKGEIDTALIELERAVILTPFTKERRIELFQTYLKRYQTRGYLKRDINRAESQYKVLLEQYPHDRKIQNLKEVLDKNRHIFTGKNSNVKFLPVAIGILLLVLGVAFSRRQILFPRLLSRFFSDKSASLPEEPEHNRAIPDSSAVALETSAIPEESYSLNIITSLFKKRNGAYFYRLTGEITPKKEQITGIVLQLDWKDSEGKTTYSHTYEALEENDAPLRPGDTLPLKETFYFKHLPEELTRASLSIAREIKSPPESYPETGLLPVIWDTIIPEGTSLETGIRSWEYEEGFDREYYSMTWELENSGYRELKTLDAEIRWKNSQGEIIESQQKKILFPEGPSLSPQKKWRFKEKLSLPQGSNAAQNPDILIKKAD